MIDEEKLLAFVEGRAEKQSDAVAYAVLMGLAARIRRGDFEEQER